MRNVFCSILLFLLSSLLYGQVSPFYAKHYSHEYAINPAVAGRDYYPVVNLSLKKYVFGVDEGAPLSMAAGTSMRLGSFNFYNPHMMLNKSNFAAKSNMGLGTFVMYEQDGPINYSHATLSYAYFIPLDKGRSELSFGLSAQIFHYGLDQNMLDPLDLGDTKLENLPKNPYKPEAGFGVYYHNAQLFLGASANDLLLSDKASSIYQQDVNKRDFFLQGGYKFFFKWLELEPSFLVAKIDDIPIYHYTQLKVYYLYYNWISVAYKSTQSMSYAVGLKVRRFAVGYIYEHSTSKMIQHYGGSHELMIGLNIGLFEAEGIRKTVR